jgi:hypothetical protein
MATERFRELEVEIGQGIDLCQQQCKYFAFCGGGPPANKYFENGTFASTETMFCRLHKQACLDVTLERLERQRSGNLNGFATELGVSSMPAQSHGHGTRNEGPHNFQLPRHLLSDWWKMLEGSRPGNNGRLKDFDTFAAKVADFLAYKGLPVPNEALFQLHVKAPGKSLCLGSEGHSPRVARIWGCVNLGETAVSLALDPPASLRLDPGEGSRIPVNGSLMDASTLEGGDAEVLLVIRYKSTGKQSQIPLSRSRNR